MQIPKTIVVTGCAGFIGSNFVQRFHERYPKTHIVGIDDLSTGRRDAVSPHITFVKGSILNETLIEKTFAQHKPDYVFHFAALPRVAYSLQFPRKSSEVNMLGTVTVLDAARRHGVKRVMYSSSSSVYGTARKFPTTERENMPNPQSLYALQKYTGEHLCRLFSSLYGLDTVSLRYFTVFGPGQYGDAAYATVICAWLESVYFPTHKKAFIEGNGTQSRDFCYIDNVVAANILAMEKQGALNGEVFNIAHGDNTSLNTLRAHIERLTGRSLAFEKRPSRVGDVRKTAADIKKARRVLGYRPTVDLEEGLRRTIAWFESRKR